MSETKGKKVLVIVIIYVLLITAGGLAWKFIFNPRRQKKLLEETKSPSLYKHNLNLALDSFSGYAILRSAEFHNDLKSQGIRMTLKDDQADYKARLAALRDGETQMAVFTVDSLIKMSAEMGEFPATIVLMIDESRGADAIIAYKNAVATLQDLDSPQAKFVLTPNSPSEFLARIVIADLNLASLPAKWWKEASGALEVRKQFLTADKKEKAAYVLWEPALSMALKEEGAHVLLDSSHLKGYILDVLVAQRKYLLERPEVVKSVVASYLRTAYYYNSAEKGMENLVLEDSRGKDMQRMDQSQAKKMADGILWKNTMENYAHFGLLSAPETQGLNHIEDIINKITQVLIVTRAMDKDPLQGDPGILFYNRILKELQSEDFHPGKRLNLIQGQQTGAIDPGKIRGEKDLPPLTEEQWTRLREIGEMRMEPISFARGADSINIQSRRDLDDLVGRLASWPRAYLRIIGHARAEGDPAANKVLAYKRADAVREYLLSRGISKNRIRVEAAEPIAKGGGEQSVTFVLGSVPY